MASTLGQTTEQVETALCKEHPDRSGIVIACALLPWPEVRPVQRIWPADQASEQCCMQMHICHLHLLTACSA